MLLKEAEDECFMPIPPLTDKKILLLMGARGHYETEKHLTHMRVGKTALIAAVGGRAIITQSFVDLINQLNPLESITEASINRLRLFAYPRAADKLSRHFLLDAQQQVRRWLYRHEAEMIAK